jgi:hypothetical protein
MSKHPIVSWSGLAGQGNDWDDGVQKPLDSSTIVLYLFLSDFCGWRRKAMEAKHGFLRGVTGAEMRSAGLVLGRYKLRVARGFVTAKSAEVCGCYGVAT